MTITHIRDRLLLGAAAGGVAAVLAACGGGGSGDGATTASRPPAQAAGSATRVTATLTDFRIQLSTRTFQPGHYSFTAENKGHHDHALELDGPGGESRSKTLHPGGSTTFEVTLKSGAYRVLCPVDGHKDLGMKTDITVAGAPAPAHTDTTSPGHGY